MTPLHARNLKPGERAELTWIADTEHAIRLANRRGQGVLVFSTPFMIMLIERAARKLLTPYLEDAEENVGMAVAIEHLAPTPLGKAVRGVATVTRVGQSTVDFTVEAWDEKELIGKGTHKRAVIDLPSFTQRVAQK